jgi:hypothetical protein
MIDHCRRAGVLLLASTIVSAPFSAARAAQIGPAEDGWLAWLGCWRADGAPAGEFLCIVPNTAGGVRMTTVVDGVIRDEAVVVTDGRTRRVRQDNCLGTEQASWSDDGQRVFLSSEVTCAQDVIRRVNGMFVFSAPDEWLSVQSVMIDEQAATRVVRYRPAEPAQLPVAIANALRNDRAARRAARLAVLTPVDAQDVSEAVLAVDATVVQEWLSTTGQPFQLDADGVSVEPAIASVSALDLTSRGAAYSTYGGTREVVHIIERPTYVTTRYVDVVRYCWDPFFSGFTFGVGYGLHFGRAYGDPYCGGRFYSRYSPWGYDLYGWRYVRTPVVIIRNGSHWQHRAPSPIRRSTFTRREGPAIIRETRTRDSQHGQVTRSGYTRGTQSRDNDSRSNRSARSVNTSTTSRAAQVESRPRGSAQAENRSRGSAQVENRSRGRAQPRASTTSQSRNESRTSSTSRTARPRSR